MSDAGALQLNVLPTTTPLLGVICTVPTDGAVFSTLTLAVELAVEPLESVAVAVQVTVDPTSVSAEETV